MARIPYVQRESTPKEVAEIFARMEANGAPVLNLWKMAANSPATLPHLIRMGNALLSKTSLDPRLREMAILRVAELAGCEYERVAHTMLGREVGMTPGQLRDIAHWTDSEAYNEVERAVLRFADEVAANANATDETFSALARHLDHRMMMELALAVGFYGMLARVLVPFRVDLDDQAPASASQIIGRR